MVNPEEDNFSHYGDDPIHSKMKSQSIITLEEEEQMSFF